MGFQGLVQSDWGAGHGTTVAEGLDMDMPLTATPDYSPTELAKIDMKDIDDAVTRTLASMYLLLRVHICHIIHRVTPVCFWIDL